MDPLVSYFRGIKVGNDTSWKLSPKNLNSQLQARPVNFESEKKKKKKLEDIALSNKVKYFESKPVRNWMLGVSKL